MRHARVGDLHQSLNNACSDTVADAKDIDTLFATGRTDIKGDADSMKAMHRLLIEKVIAPHAIETSGDKSANF